MSRFDHIFLLLDKPNEEIDSELAKHVAFVHQNSTHPALDFDAYSEDFIRAYVAAGKYYEPVIPKNLHTYIVENYIEKRKMQNEMEAGSMYITPRTLLGIIRTAQAHAKIRYSAIVEQEDVDEALRLIDACRDSFIDTVGKKTNIFNKRQDNISEIFKIISGLCKDIDPDNKTLTYARGSTIDKAVADKGYSKEDFFKALDQYTNLNVIYVSKEDETITLI
jgi:DNA replication licensing factor MCM7